MPFTVIDITNIDDPQHQVSIAQQITNAASQWGFLLIKGHAIAPQTIQEMFTLSKEFFSLPEQEKEPCPISKNHIGYVGSFKDRNRDDKMSMWFGGLPGSLNSNTLELAPFWHAKIQKIEAFKHECHTLVLKLLVCFAIAMKLPDRNFFANAHQEISGKGNSLRMIQYPARNQMPQDVGSRMQPHTDSGSVTLLFQDAPGLEVMAPNGEWIKAPCEKDCILINLGDALSFWSGNTLKATMHRVTFDGLPFNRERQSMAYFGAAEPDTVLQPLLSGVEMGRFETNGFVVESGITAGELNERVMTSIYGKAVAT